jgi:predicted RNA-binding Zn ribbon-like protein
VTERWPRLVGGNVTLDFVNTDLFSEADRSTDVLRSVDEFLAWCAHAGVASTADVPAKRPRAQEEAFLQEAVEARDSIRSIMEAIAAREQPERVDLDILRSAFVDAVDGATPKLDSGRLSWAWETTSPRGPLDELVSAAVELLRIGPVDRLKACPNCGHLFLDATKNGSRRWCSMEDCGTQAKMRRYVTKRAEQRTRN